MSAELHPFSDFDAKSLRLKQQVSVRLDKDLAALLGFSAAAWACRKRFDSFPERDLYALIAKRPDLRIDVGYVLTGTPTQTPAAANASPCPTPAMPGTPPKDPAHLRAYVLAIADAVDAHGSEPLRCAFWAELAKTASWQAVWSGLDRLV